MLTRNVCRADQLLQKHHFPLDLLGSVPRPHLLRVRWRIIIRLRGDVNCLFCGHDTRCPAVRELAHREAGADTFCNFAAGQT